MSTSQSVPNRAQHLPDLLPSMHDGVPVDERARPARPSSTRAPIPRLALSKGEAAEALGVSVDFLEEHVMHELRIVRRGRRRLIPIAELNRWIERNAHRTLGDVQRRVGESRLESIPADGSEDQSRH
jgi:excisionase family DNA binding protein